MPIVVIGAKVPAVLSDEVLVVVEPQQQGDDGAFRVKVQASTESGRQRRRARVSGGRFKADDPATPADEAWEA